MTKEELISLIDSWENMAFLVSEISKSPEYYNMLIDIALYDSIQKSWRAAYLVDLINDTKPTLLLSFLNKIIDQVKIEKNESKRRHFLKLISQNELSQEQQGELFDFCVNTLISAKETVAARVHAMQILYNISLTEPELKPEILAIIEHEIENHSTPGIASRGKKLVTKLKMP